MMDKFYILFVGAGGPEILVILLVLLLLFGVEEHRFIYVGLDGLDEGFTLN